MRWMDGTIPRRLPTGFPSILPLGDGEFCLEKVEKEEERIHNGGWKKEEREEGVLEEKKEEKKRIEKLGEGGSKRGKRGGLGFPHKQLCLLLDCRVKKRREGGVFPKGEEIYDLDEVLEHTPGLHAECSQRLILFSGNDYLGLSTHPTVRKAAAKAALEFGMGPRGSALICGYTYYHRLLETALAELKNTQECLLCPTGFSANMAVMTAITTNATSARNDPIAIFSDALNHASIIDGIRLAQKQTNVQVQVYRHCDMHHLNYLLSNCEIERKVVVTDSLFSMDGDFAPMNELAVLRKKYGFLLIIDDAHGTLVCGKHGGGVAESFNVEDEVDITIGTLSKSFGCHGGFIACSQKFKQLIQSRGRSFIFSTALPVPIVAAAHAAILVAREEKWRRKAVWERVQQFSEATGLEVKSPIVAVIIGDEEKALKASRSLLLSGFHVTAIRPPTVPTNSSRLRITVSAAHTIEDIEALASAVKPWIQEQSVLPALPQGYKKDPSQASIAQNMAEQLSYSVIPRPKL